MVMKRPVGKSLARIGHLLRHHGFAGRRCSRPAPRSAAYRVGDIDPKVDRQGSPGQLPPIVATAWIRNPRRILFADVPGLVA